MRELGNDTNYCRADDLPLDMTGSPADKSPMANRLRLNLLTAEERQKLVAGY